MFSVSSASFLSLVSILFHCLITSFFGFFFVLQVDPLTEAIRSAGLSSGNIKEKEGKKSEKPRVIGVIQLVNRKQGMKFTTNDERIVKSVGR